MTIKWRSFGRWTKSSIGSYRLLSQGMHLNGFSITHRMNSWKQLTTSLPLETLEPTVEGKRNLLRITVGHSMILLPMSKVILEESNNTRMYIFQWFLLQSSRRTSNWWINTGSVQEPRMDQWRPKLHSSQKAKMRVSNCRNSPSHPLMFLNLCLISRPDQILGSKKQIWACWAEPRWCILLLSPSKWPAEQRPSICENVY